MYLSLFSYGIELREEAIAMIVQLVLMI